MYAACMVDVVNTRMQHQAVAALDELVRRGLYASRTEAIRDAVATLLKSVREADIVESHRLAYAVDQPVDDDAFVARVGRRAYRRMVEDDA